MMPLFNKIKQLAKEQGMNIKELNRKSGLGTGVIYHWKYQIPRPTSLIKVANALNVEPQILFDINSEHKVSLNKDINNIVNNNKDNLFNFQNDLCLIIANRLHIPLVLAAQFIQDLDNMDNEEINTIINLAHVMAKSKNNNNKD